MEKNELLEALAQLVAGTSQEIAEDVTSPEVEAAKQARKAKIDGVAIDLAMDLKEVLEKYDFDTGVMLQTAAAGVAPFISVRDQYFWSLDASDKAAQRLARLEATGQWDDIERGRKDSDDDGARGQAEINPVRAAEDAVAYHCRNAEQYEILTQAFNVLWSRCEHEQIEQTGKEAGFVPEFALSEGEYAKWRQRQDARRSRNSRTQQVDASAKASKIVRETTTSFLS